MGFPWVKILKKITGVMECWSIGEMGKTQVFQYSNTPVLQKLFFRAFN
jgi:hypothetical protein